jgi:hypothetical protein
MKATITLSRLPKIHHCSCILAKFYRIIINCFDAVGINRRVKDRMEIIVEGVEWIVLAQVIDW